MPGAGERNNFGLTCLIRLLDPSCSGSGIVNRLDYLVEDGMSIVTPHKRLLTCPQRMQKRPTPKLSGWKS
jgi:hypothetical protein